MCVPASGFVTSADVRRNVELDEIHKCTHQFAACVSVPERERERVQRLSENVMCARTCTHTQKGLQIGLIVHVMTSMCVRKT